MAETYGTRPSELLGVSEPWAAFCLDEALFVRRALFLAEERGERRFRPDGYDPPAKDELVGIPWGGSEPDPLRAI
jgi:hypothetical protein